jgi:hypothetical protein
MVMASVDKIQVSGLTTNVKLCELAVLCRFDRVPIIFTVNVPRSELVELEAVTVLVAGSNDMNDVLCPAVAGVTVIEYTISLGVQ